MTANELQAILQSDKQLTLRKVTSIIYELKNDCVVFKENAYEAGFYNGEMNAFYICLDLLDKVEDSFKTMGLRRRFDVLAETIGLERTADPREILDATLKKLDAISKKLDGYNIKTSFVDESWIEDARRRGETK